MNIIANTNAFSANKYNPDVNSQYFATNKAAMALLH